MIFSWLLVYIEVTPLFFLKYIYNFFFHFFFHHTTCESTCDTLASSAANQGDNTVSVAQGGTATPGTTEQLLPPDRVAKAARYRLELLKLCYHPGWRLMRRGYRTCFHTLYDEKYIYNIYIIL